MRLEIERIITLQLTEEEALDLRTILYNHTLECALNRPQEILISKLKDALSEV